MRVEGSSRLNKSQGLDTDTDNKEKASCPNPPVCTTPRANKSLSPTPSLLISQQPCKVTREKHWRGEKCEKDDHTQTSRSSGGDSKMQREGRIYPSLHMQSWRKADDISKQEHQQASHNRYRARKQRGVGPGSRRAASTWRRPAN